MIIKRCGYARARAADTFMVNAAGGGGWVVPIKNPLKILLGENAQDHRGFLDS